MHLILGSSSKSRAKILNDNNYEFLIMNPNINEKEIGNRLKDEPSALALAVANAKADALLPHIKDKKCILITCDQVVYHNHQIREKPESKQECKEFLQSYQHYPAETHSAIVLTNLDTKRRVQGVDIAQQYFSLIPDDMVDKIIDQGDIMFCAGGFIIDIDLVQPYLLKQEGTQDSIIGMPMALFNRLYEILLKVEI